MSEYKTFEELKEELGDKFEDYTYKANIELLNKLQKKENIIKEVREYIENYCIGNLVYENKTHKRILEILDKEKE